MAKFEVFKQQQINVPDTLNKNTKQGEVSASDEATNASVIAAEKPKTDAAHELVPDYFANMKLHNPDDFLKYEKLCPKNSKTVVPDYYVRHFDPVNDEV